jgi:hypothetical protein
MRANPHMQQILKQATSTPNLMPIPLLTRLAQVSGTYRGEGLNHANEKFTGEFTLKSDLDEVMIEIRFRASEDASKADSVGAFHEERTWITEDLLLGGISMWTVSSNTPGVLQLKLTEDSSDGSYATRVVFRLGEPTDTTRFREEISLSIRHDMAIEYVYSWGVPHEKFEVKSRVLLLPVLQPAR